MQMRTIPINASWPSRVTTDSTDIPLIMVQVIPIEAQLFKFHRAPSELRPNNRIGGSSSYHGTVVPLGIHRGYVGIQTNELVENAHVVNHVSPFQLRLAQED